ncbi:RluA family pseudouridine synthase [Lactobacillus sp. CC-MHH1034]|uniref:RluA family pseudouridine synthase n=1 Tax=Agrilactobacillus fermenti TaxID=2586909 RepID=UPI001E3399C1|nr:RluA family pseudouridine synthase [Agrilactobacillus fermenti]MCD2255454.1 RluA family pseudouridine synthase [Agrilactobacillus fermenti]
MNFSWYVPDDFPRKSLEKFLEHQGLSKSIIAKTKFNGGAIYVNHHRRNTDYPIKPKDHITVTLPPEKDAKHLVPVHRPLDIIFEDPHFLVVNKPAGLPSIPSRSSFYDSVANRVKGHLVRRAHESLAIHVVSRLDQDTSGLMLFAKHSFAHSVMAKQLHQQAMQKYYLALVVGHLAKPQGLIDQPIKRTAPYAMKRSVGIDGRPAQTKYRVLAEFPDMSLVQLKLLTGRTHQIRVHMQWLGHPLIGDPLYNPENQQLHRQALHAWKLCFKHPFTSELLTFQAPLPADIQQLLYQRGWSKNQMV